MELAYGSLSTNTPSPPTVYRMEVCLKVVFVCGECGQEYTSGEDMLMLHLKMTGHCNQSGWTHNSYSQGQLQQRFEESLTREDVDLLREYKVKV